MKSFKIALAQFSPHVGNIDANTQKMIEQANLAKKDNADLISRTFDSGLPCR